MCIRDRRTIAAVGIATDGVGTTPWAGQFRPDREMSEDAKRLFQLLINDSYQDFITAVAESRELDLEFVDEIAQGQIWTGEEAFENGLVDVLGDVDDAIVAAAKLAGMEEGDYGQKLIERALSPTEQLILDMLSTFRTIGIDPAALVDKPEPLQVFANHLQKMLAHVAQFNDPKGIYANCFCEVE